MSKIFNTSPESSYHQISPIEEFRDIVSPSICHLSGCFILTVDASVRQSKDRLELGFLDCKKINEIPNFNLTLIVTLDLLGIQQVDLSPYSGRDLLAFNDSITLLKKQFI